MFQSLCRSSRSTNRMPVSLSEWRVRIGSYVPRMLQYNNLVRYLKQLLFLAILQTLADGESNGDPSEKQEMGSTSDNQSSTDKTSSKPEKDDNSFRGCDGQETSDNTKAMPSKTSKKKKRRSDKGTVSGRSSGSFVSFRRFMKSCASPLLRFMLLVFTAILLVRSGDVEVNPGPNEENTIADITLLNIAKAIPQTKMYDVGINLGMNLGTLKRHRTTNTMGGAANWNGTLDMLEDWRENTSMEKQKDILRNALNASSLHAVAEEYFPEASRANLSPGPVNLKRTASGTPVNSEHSHNMPSTSGHTSTCTYVPQNTPAPSTNCNNPISEVQLERCIADIQDYYRVQLCQISTCPLDSNSIVELQSIFTNLSLVKEDRNKQKKIPLKYEDLLTVDMNGKPARCIMIQGEAGVGKTTFCAKIAWDWVTGAHYQDYTLVAVVPLRDANNGKTVGQVLKTYLSDDNDVTSEQLDEYIRTNQKKVLTVFDGFDEFSVEMSNEENQIVQILKGKRQTSGRVIVTTRPWKAQEITIVTELTKQYAHANIEGFKKRDIKTYVNRFYQNDKTSAQTLLEYMEEGSLIAETMAPFPIFCSMLCHLWKEVEHRKVICKLQTFSQLFQEMMSLLKQHYVSKHINEVNSDSVEKFEERINHHFEKISEVAFNGLLDKKLVFLEERFSSCVDDLRVACEVGILTKERTKHRSETVRKMARLESTVSFPHKLFQEYIAGLYLQNLSHSNKVEFKRKMKRHILKKSREFRYLLYFVGSLDDDIAKYIVTNLMARKQSRLNFIVEVALECQSEEAAKLIEAQHPEINQSLTIKKGTRDHVIAGYIFTFKHLVSLHIEKFCSSKALSRIIADTVCSVKSLKELKIRQCTLVDEFIRSIEERAEDVMVESLELEAVNISVDGSRSLGASIRSMSCLRSVNIVVPQGKRYSASEAKITLRKNAGGSSSEVISSSCQININLDKELIIAFVASLSSSQTSSPQVESLQIDDCYISESASQTLGASICAMTYVKDLKLSGELSDGFYSALIKGASSLKVGSLQIDDHGISESASQTLGASICAMPYLQHVKLSGKLSDGFYNEFKEGASSLKVESLQILVDDHGISESASQTLGASICAMTYVKDLKLLLKLSDGFYSALIKGASSLKVESLQIDDRGISESASETLGASICDMPYLKDVKLIGKLSDGFYSALSEGASSLKVESLQIDDYGISESASQTLGASICAMQYLKDVKLHVIGKLSDGFYSTLSEGASSLKVESLQIHDRGISESASQTLGAIICVMPCLKDVKLRENLSDGFYSALSEGASSLKMKQMHLMGATLDSCHLSAIALLPDLKLLTLFDIKIDDRNHTEMDGSDPPFIHSSTSLTELNVDKDSFKSLHRIGLLKRFPCIQKMTLAFSGQTPFSQELSHHVTMPDVTDLFLHGFYRNVFPEMSMLSLELFPNLINLSLVNITIRNDDCTTILNSLRNNETLKTISIKDCRTYARLYPLVDEINAEGKMMVTVEHGRSKFLELGDIF